MITVSMILLLAPQELLPKTKGVERSCWAGVDAAWVMPGAGTSVVISASKSALCAVSSNDDTSEAPTLEKESNDELLSAAARKAQVLREEAARLRAEVDSLQARKEETAQAEILSRQTLQQEQEALRDRYSALIPILKPDGSVSEERCDFAPRFRTQKTVSSYITVCEAFLPLGIILGESEEYPGMTVVDEVADGSNGQDGGIQVGDMVRACTACRVEMTAPTWQLLVGGIGQPKTVRFMYLIDNRPFEEVMEAVASNRMDPESRPVLLVVERQETE
jgi:hypothetical protein